MRRDATRMKARVSVRGDIVAKLWIILGWDLKYPELENGEWIFF